jgi:heptosyltransferase-2
MATPKKILIVGPSWVGDMVMAQTLFILLKRKYPDCLIDVLAPRWSEPLLARMPEVYRSVVMPIGHGELAIGKRLELGRGLAKQGYDQAILLPNSIKSALIPFFADIPVRTGWRGEMRFWLVNDIRLLIKTRYPLMIERFAALAFPPNADLPKDLPRPRLEVIPEQVQHLAQGKCLHDTPFLALCPGAEFGPAKRWPEEHYAGVAKHYLAKGWKVVLFGSAKDQPVGEAIRQHLADDQQRNCLNLCGTTSLAEAIDLMSLATAVVSNDSGLMHIAAALNRPLAVVYGSTSPEFTPPLSDKVVIERLGLDCSPCFKRECPLEHLNCLKQLEPQRVIDGLEKLLETPA